MVWKYQPSLISLHSMFLFGRTYLFQQKITYRKTPPTDLFVCCAFLHPPGTGCLHLYPLVPSQGVRPLAMFAVAVTACKTFVWMYRGFCVKLLFSLPRNILIHPLSRTNSEQINEGRERLRGVFAWNVISILNFVCRISRKRDPFSYVRVELVKSVYW